MGITSPNIDAQWMQYALAAAIKAQQADEVPVGAVLVIGDELIATAWNSPIMLNDPSAHAEVLVLRKAAEKIKNYRLPGATLYVTLEPCMMCAGAMLHARIDRLVFGAYDEKTGVAGSCFNWLQHEKHLHKLDVTGGVLEQQCSELLKTFFKTKRTNKK